jgi:2-(1,2-epoxy-1,2-dihydrophenyl)acetyl-CoA isomerase
MRLHIESLEPRRLVPLKEAWWWQALPVPHTITAMPCHGRNLLMQDEVVVTQNEAGLLVTHPADDVTLLTLNRPDRRNAFSLDMLKALERAIYEATATNSRSIILSGAGPVFSAGGDVKIAREFLAEPERFDAVWEELMATFSRVVLALRATPAVTLAALEGAAVGAGISLALAVDLKVAGDGFRFVPGWLERGTPPDGGGSYFLTRHIGSQATVALILRGQHLSSSEAVRRGLIDEVVPDGSALPRCLDLAEELSDRSGPALVALRRLADSATRQGLADQVTLETDLLRDLRKGSDRQRRLAPDSAKF